MEDLQDEFPGYVEVYMDIKLENSQHFLVGVDIIIFKIEQSIFHSEQTTVWQLPNSQPIYCCVVLLKFATSPLLSTHK